MNNTLPKDDGRHIRVCFIHKVQSCEVLVLLEHSIYIKHTERYTYYTDADAQSSSLVQIHWSMLPAPSTRVRHRMLLVRSESPTMPSDAGSVCGRAGMGVARMPVICSDPGLDERGDVR